MWSLFRFGTLAIGDSSPSIATAGGVDAQVRRLAPVHHNDLAYAYNQIKLCPESRKRLALSTHRGVLLQNVLPFRISSASGYFQNIMDSLTATYREWEFNLDDILVSGASADEHLQNLKRLLQRLHEKGLRCRLLVCPNKTTRVFGSRSLSE